ncbi:MAG: serine hydrolase [Candidatus Eremiobacteraeota bacterium]|nr:serine hydrolase [Candidatus Eremiobacteraeota bacterium]
MKKRLVILLLVFILQAGIAFAQEKVTKPADEELKKILADFDQYASKARADWKIPGMAIGIVQDGRLVFAKGYGVKKLGGSDPVTENTIFQIGSTTKAFTSTLAAMLVDEGKYKWDDKVVEHLPDFMMYDPWVTREFQIVDLMSQHSGMPGYAADTLYFLGFDRQYIRQAVRNIKPVTSFRAKFAYQNGLWLVASELIEKYSGMSWEQALKERIFEPLGMSDSSADMQSFLNARDVSSLHAAQGDNVTALPENRDFLDWSYTAGPAGAINSNIVDMAKWLTFQINNGKVGGKQLVSEKNMEVLHSPKTIIGLGGKVHKNIFYCMGWIYQEYSPCPIIWHNGGTSMKTMVAYVPEQKIGIVILSNYVTTLPELLAYRFIDQYAGKPARDLSAEALAESEKAKKEAKVLNPVAPKNPVAAMPLEKYAGYYSNEVYGKIKIAVDEGKLTLVIGPRNMKLPLVHWNANIFAVHWPAYDSDTESSFALFQIDPHGRVTGVTIDSLNQGDDLGVFKRVGDAPLKGK